MAAVKGLYSKGIDGGFDENERLLFGLVRPGIPWVDGDENRTRFAQFTWIRRALDTVIGNASPNDGFRFIGDGSNNDVLIEGGDGSLTGAGRIWISGFHCFLTANIRYVNTGTTADEASIYPEISFITGLTNQVIEDTAADYVTNSLVGRVITPDVSQPSVTASILSNDGRTITTDTDLTAAGIAPGARYRIEMRTPVGSGRNDGVYLNVAIDEIDGTEQPSITHSLGTQITAQFFAQVRCSIEIHENDATGLPGNLSSNYIDADGFEHVRVKIANITRLDGQDAINGPDVTDLRFTSGDFTNFLNKTGDNMSGDLVMQAADIFLDAGRLVDGRDVSVDGTKLDGVTFTPDGIATQLQNVSAPVQGADLAGVTTTQIRVSKFLKGKLSDATESVKGLFTTLPNNRVVIQKTDDSDDLVDALGNKVFGRLTQVPAVANLTGTWTFTNATVGVTGVGGNALSELQQGDIVQGPDSVFYTVDTVLTDDSFDLEIGDPFAGTTGPIAGPAVQRWLLDLVSNVAGTETVFTPTGATNISWFYHEVFDTATRPVIDPLFSIASDQVAAEVPDATPTVAGKVKLVSDGIATTAGAALAASDARAGQVQGSVADVQPGGDPRRPRIDMVAGSGIDVVVVDNTDRLTFTITNLGGVGGPPSGAAGGDLSGTYPDPLVGTVGGITAAVIGGLPALDGVRVKADVFAAGSTTLTTIPAFRPRCAIYLAEFTPAFVGSGIGVGVTDGTVPNSGCVAIAQVGAAAAGFGFTPGVVIGDGTSAWTMSAFTAAGVTATRSAGTATTAAIVLVIGDNLP